MINIRKTNAGTYVLECKQLLSQPREAVFPFFADAQNLERITPPWLSFQVLDENVEMRPGALINYRLRLRGIPLRWQSEITAWEPPFRFVDEQRKGPYRLWVHEHTFEERDGHTIVGDRVEYAVPGGSLVNRFFVEPDVRKIFEYRHKVLSQRFCSPQPAAAT